MGSCLGAFGHPLITEVRQQVNVEFIGEEKGFGRQQPLDKRVNTGEFRNPLRIVVMRDMTGSLPLVVSSYNHRRTISRDTRVPRRTLSSRASAAQLHRLRHQPYVESARLMMASSDHLRLGT